MASITKGYTFGSTELVTNAKLHTLVDSATLSGIVNADIDASADILESKLKFDDSSGHTHSGSGSNGTKIDLSAPNAIGGTTPADGTFDALVGTTIDGSLGSVTPAAIVGTTLKANTSLELATGATVTGIADEDDMTSDSATLLATQQSIKAYADKKEVFTSSGTFTVPSGVTQVFVTGCGAGAGGGGGCSSGSGSLGGGGGSAGAQAIKYPITTTPGASITVTINAGGSGGSSSNDGNDGGTSVFGSLTLAGGNKGLGCSTGGVGAGGLDSAGTGLQGGSGGAGGNKTGGAGGSSLTGKGGAGVNRNPGNDGTGYGSGGSGGGGDDGGYTAGDGKSGIIIVEW